MTGDDEKPVCFVAPFMTAQLCKVAQGNTATDWGAGSQPSPKRMAFVLGQRSHAVGVKRNTRSVHRPEGTFPP